ncbi:MAG: manganese efflux pump MntP family protein [Lautropia sp.]|nr:manganese efflux pump MntP family protein [Lautropia sp.]
MSVLSLLMLGLAMSTDAFAAAVGKGAGMTKPRWADALRIGLIFGVVEAITPAVGWMLGSVASRMVQDYDHWIAFVLLACLGLHMVYKACQPGETEGESPDDRDTAGRGSPEPRMPFLRVALTGLATSIDAMAVGVGLAFVDVSIVLAAGIIGLCTFVMVTLGIMAGRLLGEVAGRRAELFGGLILITVGAVILHEHLRG